MIWNLIRRFLAWALGDTDEIIAQNKADTAQETHLTEQTNAIQHAQANEPANRGEFMQRVRSGDSL